MSRLVANEELEVNVSVKAGTRRRLLALLDRPDITRSLTSNLTPSQFIEWAIGVATRQLDVCEDDGSGDCFTHTGGRRDFEDAPCDLAGLGALYPIDRT